VRISAIVPATDQPTTLDRCVRAAKRALGPHDELIVIREPVGLGPAAARNLGVQSAVGDLLVFVDSDVEVHEDAFARIMRAFEEDDELVALFGSYDDDPERHGRVSDFRNLLHHHVHHEGGGPATTFWSGLGALRRNAFHAVGGFDERLRYLEDVDLGIRLVESNSAKILLDPAVQGKHLKQWTLANMIYTDFAGRGVPWIRLLVNNRSASSSALNLGWRHRLSAAASILVVASLLARKPRTAVGAAGILLAANRSFYALLVRSRDWRQVVVGVPLHVVHHVVGVAAVPTALMLELNARFADWRKRQRSSG